jgi:hypothetical protein
MSTGEKEILIIANGKRRYLHPQLAILEEIDCRVWYDREYKFFYVEYDFVDGVPNKSILTKETGSILQEIGRYRARQQEQQAQEADDSYQNSRRE